MTLAAVPPPDNRPPHSARPPAGWLAELVELLRALLFADRWAPTLRLLLIAVVVVVLWVVVSGARPVPTAADTTAPVTVGATAGIA